MAEQNPKPHMVNGSAFSIMASPPLSSTGSGTGNPAASGMRVHREFASSVFKLVNGSLRI